MAFSVTATIAVDNATPKIGQPVTLTLTVDNSGGTVDVAVTGINPSFATPVGGSVPGVMGQPAVGTPVAGSRVVFTPVTVAAAATQTFTWKAVLHAALAVTITAIANATRADTGAVIAIPASSAVTVTAS